MFSKILVTGCGGDIGLALGRIIKMSAIAESVIGCDIHDDHAGEVIFNRCFLISRAGSPTYLDNLLDLCEINQVDLIIPGSEPELRFLYRQGISDFIEDIPLITVNKKALQIGFDKLQTAEFLQAEGLPYPWTKTVQEGAPEKLPCILKSRSGSGSKSVHLVKDQALIDYYRRICPEDIWQEYLQPDDQEYTCGLYRTKSGEIRTIIFKRVLAGGRTGSGEVVENDEIKELLTRVARALNLTGSINVQLRLTARGPVIFEINPRFSSTVVFRHLLGFSDLIWSVKEKAGLPLDSYHAPKPGARFYRGDREIIIDNDNWK